MPGHDFVPVGSNLLVCTVCECGEGTLLTHCPGYRLNTETQEAIFRGRVVDLEWQRRLRRRVL